LRDYLKSQEFSAYFKNALIQYRIQENTINKVFSEKSYSQLELPGDVWNNNSKFRNCILSNTEFKDSKRQLNIILRDYYASNHNIIGYPEQFDITFNFVPRMCDLDNCDICPIYKISKSNNFEKVCINDKTKYCPIALIGCNYKNMCIGDCGI